MGYCCFNVSSSTIRDVKGEVEKNNYSFEVMVCQIFQPSHPPTHYQQQ